MTKYACSVMFYRGKTFPLLQVFRYSKKSGEEFQELVPDDTSSKIHIQNNNRVRIFSKLSQGVYTLKGSNSAILIYSLPV